MMRGENKKMLFADNCNTPDGLHDLASCEPPWYGKCKVCGARFILINETVVEQLGLEIYQRPTNVQ